jgi:acyl carrier protein
MMKQEDVKKVLQMVADQTITPQNAASIIASWKEQGFSLSFDPEILTLLNKVSSTEDKKTTQSMEDILKHEMTNIIANTLKMELSEVELGKPIQSYGIDSVTAAEITMYFRDKYSIPLTPPMLFEMRNLNEYIAQILAQYRQQIEKYYQNKSATFNAEQRPEKNQQERPPASKEDFADLWQTGENALKK